MVSMRMSSTKTKVSATGVGYSSSLHDAALKGDVAQLTKLLEKCHVDTKSDEGATPLLAACFSESGGPSALSCVECLLQKGANPNASDDDGCLPLHAAAFNGRVEIVECLLQNKAQVDMGDFGGVTALIVACASGHAAVVASLLKAGADPEVNVHGEDGVISPMTEAKAEANQDCVDLLRAAISAKKLLP